VEAVIDKDLSAQCLASLIDATDLVLLTEVEQVAIDYGTPSQRPLGTVTVEEMKSHLAGGQFPEGSMGPKVRAAIAFVEAGGRRTIITSASRMVEAVTHGNVGTHVYARVPQPAGSSGVSHA
jgi:carbamate kinase